MCWIGELGLGDQVRVMEWVVGCSWDGSRGKEKVGWVGDRSLHGEGLGREERAAFGIIFVSQQHVHIGSPSGRMFNMRAVF
jgi:hypothetical protein